MKPQASRSRNIPKLIEELNQAMHDKDYGIVDELLSENPQLINGLTAKCEVPLVMAIRYWDCKLVEICMRHGANPEETHMCSKDNGKRKIPMLIANEVFNETLKASKFSSEAFQKHFRIYASIMQTMEFLAPLKRSGE